MAEKNVDEYQSTQSLIRKLGLDSTEGTTKLRNVCEAYTEMDKPSNDSIASVIFHWRKTYSKQPLMVADRESVRHTDASGMFLYLTAMLLMCTGCCMITVSVWGMLYRSPYMQLSEGSYYLDANIFLLCAGFISTPCGWIAWLAHNDKKNYTFLSLLMGLLTCSLIFLTTGGILGFLYRSRVNFVKGATPLILKPSRYKNNLNESMLNAIQDYDTIYRQKNAWDTVQRRLKCCGVNSPQDWLPVRKNYPWSCYETENQTYRNGCLSLLAFELGYESSLLTGTCCVVFVVQVISLLLVSFIYVKEKYRLTIERYVQD